MLLGLSHTLRRAIEPILIASQAIPPVIFAPILIAAMGFRGLAKNFGCAPSARFSPSRSVRAQLMLHRVRRPLSRRPADVNGGLALQ